MSGNKEVEKRKKSNCYGPGFRSVWQSCSFFSHLASCQWRPEQGNPVSRISLSSNCWTLSWNCPSSLILSHQSRIVRLIIALNKWQVLLYPGAKWLQKGTIIITSHSQEWRSCVIPSTSCLWILVVDMLMGKQHTNIAMNSEVFLCSPHESLTIIFLFLWF